MQQSQCLGKAETESLGRLLGLAGVALGLQDQQNQGRWESQDQTWDQHPGERAGQEGRNKMLARGGPPETPGEGELCWNEET